MRKLVTHRPIFIRIWVWTERIRGHDFFRKISDGIIFLSQICTAQLFVSLSNSRVGHGSLYFCNFHFNSRVGHGSDHRVYDQYWSPSSSQREQINTMYPTIRPRIPTTNSQHHFKATSSRKIRYKLRNNARAESFQYFLKGNIIIFCYLY